MLWVGANVEQIMDIPLDMRRHLPAHFYSALETHSPLKGSAIHGAVMELVEFYHIQLEMVFPPLNFPLLIYKHMRDLALPSKSPNFPERMTRLTRSS